MVEAIFYVVDLLSENGLCSWTSDSGHGLVVSKP